MRRMLLLAAAALGLAGCAYKPLKAPCSPDEGAVPLSYAPVPANATPEAFRSLDGCGPMRPI